MALMYPRLASNFAKNGYYPTDEKTLECILSHLHLEDDNQTQIFDPCCGEGVALAEIKHSLGQHQSRAFGIEYNAERAYHSKNLLDVCVHGDMQDCIIKRNQFGLLFLNPPYGDMVSDNAQLSDKQFSGQQRLEKLFYQHTFQSLVFGGVMILIIPENTLDKEYASWIAKHFSDVTLFRAADQTFKQLVIFGVRKRTSQTADFTQVRDFLLERETLTEIPILESSHGYVVPQVVTDIPLVYTKMDTEQLSDDLNGQGSRRGMWGDFQTVFAIGNRITRRPLMDLSDWHLALALAAGQVTGQVESNDGQTTYMIKGNTHKEKMVTTAVHEDPSGNVTETRTHTDRFVSVIKGIDTTRGPNFGNIVTIR